MESNDEQSQEDYNDEISNNSNDGNHENLIENEVDSNTLRIMISTDNHVGYLERDAVRGLDSFAALEEVLRLAKQTRCDLVLLSGDLFHENKPSRRTYHKTMDIFRRYCMGPDPVLFRIISDPKRNFNKNLNQTVNYEDPYYSVDLPVFAIHGNHDDPTRDGGTDTDMLAALDLLSISNLVNYFGTAEQIDNVNISPILINKGTTNVALYGLGNLRDERLNRMWQGKKVRFLKPMESKKGNEDDDESDDEKSDAPNPFFNIFSIHQNRDLGRGSKNCVHESMIPEWMDLVVWGHEHECLIDVSESLVGTFRISQPGSSVATSLVHGEAVRKKVGILDIRGQQFRLNPIPLTQVRPFVMSEISLNNQPNLDPDDPRIDKKATDILTNEVNQLIKDAREKAESLRKDANATKASNEDENTNLPEQKYKMKNPDEVLVRLKVEHSGFTTLNNQRFGAQFVGQIANPSDVLLFHRRRKAVDGKVDKSKNTKNQSLLETPIPPAELLEMNVEDLIQDNLNIADERLDLLDEKKMAIAMEHFVDKEQKRAIDEIAIETLTKQQKKLVKRGISNGGDDEMIDFAKLTTAAGVREICQAEAEKVRAKATAEAEKDKRSSSRNQSIVIDDESSNDDDDDAEKSVSTKRQKATVKKTRKVNPKSKEKVSRNPARRPTRSTRRTAIAPSKKSQYRYDDDDENSDAEISDPSESFHEDDLDHDSEQEPPTNQRKRKTTPSSTSVRKQSKLTSSQSNSSRSMRRRGTKTYVEEDSDDEDDEDKYADTMKIWGTGSSQLRSRQSRR